MFAFQNVYSKDFDGIESLNKTLALIPTKDPHLAAIANKIPLPEESLLDAIKLLFAKKSERIIQLNIDAFFAGKSLLSPH